MTVKFNDSGFFPTGGLGSLQGRSPGIVATPQDIARYERQAAETKWDNYGIVKDVFSSQIDFLSYLSRAICRDLLTMRIPYSMPLPSGPNAQVIGSYHLNCAQALINAISRSERCWTTVQNLASRIKSPHATTGHAEDIITLRKETAQIRDQLVEIFNACGTFIGAIDTLMSDLSVPPSISNSLTDRSDFTSNLRTISSQVIGHCSRFLVPTQLSKFEQLEGHIGDYENALQLHKSTANSIYSTHQAESARIMEPLRKLIIAIENMFQHCINGDAKKSTQESTINDLFETYNSSFSDNLNKPNHFAVLAQVAEAYVRFSQDHLQPGADKWQNLIDDCLFSLNPPSQEKLNEFQRAIQAWADDAKSHVGDLDKDLHGKYEIMRGNGLPDFLRHGGMVS
ncbi:hypothetical protein BDV23DRAFT_144114 [Aspergillus alliaceus]|uniref:Uncharacterized protein n=1 Tax=Petromyces alliaceus TaxID=209559 RepID=A0A5N7CPH4_PETAA|nr:hypothetical protein BDV23DRAFT_144114 [Aspergillus alliaceus]